jgi:hypothetical protein
VIVQVQISRCKKVQRCRADLVQIQSKCRSGDQQAKSRAQSRFEAGAEQVQRCRGAEWYKSGAEQVQVQVEVEVQVQVQRCRGAVVLRWRCRGTPGADAVLSEC